jgi:hypothetical protein
MSLNTISQMKTPMTINNNNNNNNNNNIDVLLKLLHEQRMKNEPTNIQRDILLSDNNNSNNDISNNDNSNNNNADTDITINDSIDSFFGSLLDFYGYAREATSIRTAIWSLFKICSSRSQSDVRLKNNLLNLSLIAIKCRFAEFYHRRIVDVIGSHKAFFNEPI